MKSVYSFQSDAGN